MNQALDLWIKAVDKSEVAPQEFAEFEYYRKRAEDIAIQAKLPDDGNYDLKTFLRTVVGGKTDKIRRKKFKHFLTSSKDKYPFPEKTLSHLEKEGFENEEFWVDAAEVYQAWMRKTTKENKQKAGRARQKNRAGDLQRHIYELLDDVERDRLRPRKYPGKLNEFLATFFEGKNNNVNISRFSDFLETLPETEGKRHLVADKIAEFQTDGFTKDSWKQMGIKSLHWRKAHLKEELSPNKLVA